MIDVSVKPLFCDSCGNKVKQTFQKIVTVKVKTGLKVTLLLVSFERVHK